MYNFFMPSSENSDLSERELDILRLVATGASNKEIARKLFISPNTVKVHLRNIFAKIGVLSRTEAALYAVNHGLVKTALQSQALNLPVSVQEPEGGEAALTQLAPLPAGNPRSRRLGWLSLGVVALLLILAGVGYRLLNQPDLQPAQPSAALLTDSAPTSSPTSTLSPRWQVLTPLKVARSGLALAALDGALYAIGGETQQGVSGILEAYDPDSATWSERRSLPLPVADIQAAALGGRLYVPGGRMEDGRLTDKLQIYDPLRDAWENGADLPYPLSAYALAAWEGRLYLFGGWDGERASAGVLIFDPSLGAWSQGSPMPASRMYCAAAPAGGKIYVLGGLDGGQPLALNEAYSPNLEDSGASPWASAPALPEGRYAMGVASIADTILIIGGVNDSNDAAVSYHFFPSLGEWVEIEPPIPQAWTHLSATPLEQLVFAVGGRLNDEVTALAQSYQAVYTILIPIVR